MWTIYIIMTLLFISTIFIIRILARKWGKEYRYRSSWDILMKEDNSRERDD